MNEECCADLLPAARPSFRARADHRRGAAQGARRRYERADRQKRPEPDHYRGAESRPRSPRSTRSTRSSPRTPTPTTARPPFCSCSCRAPSRSAIWTARQCSRTCATAHTPPGSRPAGSTGRSSCLKRTRAAKCSVAGAWRATGAASAPWRSATLPPPTRRPGPARKITAIS